MFKVAKFIHANQFDTVISILNSPNFYAAILKKVFWLSPRFIISHGSKTNFEEISRTRKYMLEWTNDVVDVVTCNSFHEKETMVRNQLF